MARKTKNPVTLSQIEQKYEKGDARLIQERSDFLLPQIFDFVKTKNWMNLQPEYQRRQVWDRKRRSLLIESLLLNIPIPPVFLYEVEYNRYEVMDGQQRLSAIVDFYENRFSLVGLEKWKELNGFSYSDMPPIVKRGLDRRRISATVLLAENSQNQGSEAIRREVFERLNTGGMRLQPQELRNSLYSGPFNALLIKLAGNSVFDAIWGIPLYKDHYREGVISPILAKNPLFKRMSDCEIVLRFFAFRRASSKIKGAAKKILDECMAENRDTNTEDISTMEIDFINALELSSNIFGTNVFRVYDLDTRKWNLSEACFDAVMIATDRLKDKSDKLIAKHKVIQTAFRKACQNEKKYELLVGRMNTADSIRERIDLAEQIMDSAI